jgi:predicted membrane-bound dolichyl-phosphate-mannose-protein mannosyltransferase
LNETVRIYEQQGKALPALLRRHKESFSANPPYEVPDIKQVLSYYNSEHSIPEKFMNTVREMYTFVQDK